MHYRPCKAYVRCGTGLTLLFSILTNCWAFTIDRDVKRLLAKRSAPANTSPSSANNAREDRSNSAAVQFGLTAENTFNKNLGNMPLSFEPNEGQADQRVKFMSRGVGYGILLLPQELVLTFISSESPTEDKLKGSTHARHSSSMSSLGMRLENSNPNSRAVGLDELPGNSNYFLGNDRQKWKTNIANYSKVKYEEIYPGIDMVYYGNQQNLEYDFVIAPRAVPLG